jgi:hypothetical protein
LSRSGAYSVPRKDVTFYAKGFMDLPLKILDKFLPVNIPSIQISKREYNNRLYQPQLKRLLGKEDYHLMIFPGYETKKNGDIKLGRSYTGVLPPLHPAVFIQVERAVKSLINEMQKNMDEETEKKILQLSSLQYQPVKIAYERVVEDFVFTEMEARSEKSAFAKNLYDHYINFIYLPYIRNRDDKQSRVWIRFGEPVPVLNEMDNKKELPEYLREQISKMNVIHPSLLIFSSLNDKYRISRAELEKNMVRNLRKLERYGAEIEPMQPYMQKINNELHLDLEPMLELTKKYYNNEVRHGKLPIRVGKILAERTIDYDANSVTIWHPELADYYKNKLIHILKPKGIS